MLCHRSVPLLPLIGLVVSSVHFTVTMSVEDLDAIDKGEGLYKFFKLESTLNTTNMVMFDTAGQLIR